MDEVKFSLPFRIAAACALSVFGACCVFPYPSRPYVVIVDELRTLLGIIDLLVHEAGHEVFRPLGEVLFVMGGSLFQLIVPAALCIGAAVTGRGPWVGIFLFWLGESLVGVSIYIADARAKALPLFADFSGTGEGHDWHFLLERWNLLPWDQTFGAIGRAIAAGLMVTGIVILLVAPQREDLASAASDSDPGLGSMNR